jgi:hypothetical protein
MEIAMNFLQIRHFLAQILLSGHLFILALLCLTNVSLSAETASGPIVLPAVELIAPVQLVDGIVSEVVVTPNEKELSASDEFQINISKGKAHAEYDQNLTTIFPKNTVLGKHSQLKSIANLAQIAFFEICLSQSELPFKNSSTPCVSFLSKSTIPRYANDWRSLWQQVRMTYPSHKSICSLQTLAPSIPVLFPNHLPSMSDTTSIWSKEAIVCLKRPILTQIRALPRIRPEIQPNLALS